MPRSGYAYTLGIYFVTWIVIAFIWGTINWVHADIITAASGVASTATAEQGIDWAALAWKWVPLWTGLVLMVRLISKATFSSRVRGV